MHYSPPSLSERAAAYDAIAAVIHDYLPGGVSPAAALGQIITIVDLTGVHKDDADQLDLPLAA
jgi:hypothetical protein